MLFNSWLFAAFFAVVLPTYWGLRRWHKVQNAFLLAASLVFYGAWDWRFLGLLACSSAVDFFAAQRVEDASAPARKKAFLVASLVVNLCVLGFFKYFNFFAASFEGLMAALGMSVHPVVLKVALPVGISFYTFQAMSYVIDVYRGDLKATRSAIDYGLFIAFFPHLVAGPIQRPVILLPQVIHPRVFSWAQANAGLLLMVWGYFKKVVVADNAALIANPIFDGYASQSSLDLVIGALAFTVQIYGDFSGYSDIARGISKLFGFDLMVNFRLPYFALSPSEFWQRWHISLSTWLRDYLYIGLGGNRGTATRTYRNLFLTMLLGGLWHGAAWNFVAWGAYHGVLLIVYRALGAWLGPAPRVAPVTVLRWGVMFSLTVVGWILFRASSWDQLWFMVTHLGVTPSAQSAELAQRLLVFSAPLMLVQFWQARAGDLIAPAKRGPVALGLAYATMIAAIAVFGVRTSMEFIYFQF